LALAAAVVASAPLGAQQPTFSGVPQSLPGTAQPFPGAPRATPGMPQAMPHVPAEYQKMIAQMQAAQSGAQRPGDESLSCEALKAGIEAAMNAAASVGKGDADDGLAVPEAAPPPSLQLQQIEYGAMLPHLARSQRLTELAALKNCAWLGSAGFPTGLDAGLDEAGPARQSPD
jgi:hypothetical protein